MVAKPVDMQVILPQSGQANKLNRGLQFQQQTEQQVLAQQIKQQIRQQEQRVNKATTIEHRRIDNEDKGKQGSSYYLSRDNQNPQEQNENKEPEIKAKKGEPGSILDIII